MSADSQKWSSRHPAIRRIRADVRELACSPSYAYVAEPNEDDVFDWHFLIRGPEDTSFEGGIYHGRILLPSDYPFKSPNIVFLTPNGRWEVGYKICLSISAHHPETWQPAWGVRTMLEALISFMDAPFDGALGAVDCSDTARERLAKESLHDVTRPEKLYERLLSHAHLQKAAMSVPAELHLSGLGKEEDGAGAEVVEEEEDVEEVVEDAPPPQRTLRISDSVDDKLWALQNALLFALAALLYRKLLQAI